jgi:uncharacterized membrane protein
MLVNIVSHLALCVIAVLALAVVSVLLIVYMTLKAVLSNVCGGGRHKDDDKELRKRKGTKGVFRLHFWHIFIILGCCSPSQWNFVANCFGGRVLASPSRVV